MNPRRLSLSSNAATGMAAFKLSPPQGVPKEVQASFLLWLTAVAAGVLETINRVINSQNFAQTEFTAVHIQRYE